MVKRKNHRMRSTGLSLSQRRRQKKRLKLGSKIFQNDDIRKAWNDKLSLAQNYRRLGLLGDINQVVYRPGCRGASQTGDEWAKGVEKPGLLTKELVKTQNVPYAPPVEAKAMPLRDRTIVEKLIARFGDDISKMSRDIKINEDQWTKGQITRKVAMYRRIYKSEEK